MPAEIRVLGMRNPSTFDQQKSMVINVCSNTYSSWMLDLSPFILGPCPLYGGRIALRHENSWQFAKVYSHHLTNGEPNADYWKWAEKGWADSKAHRFPMGRGARPAYSFWDGKKLGYIDARKQIYVPLYAEAVQKTAGYQHLKELYEKNLSDFTLILRDFDGYDHVQMKQSLTQVLNNPKKKCGHSFVLMMLLTQDPALKQCTIW